MELVSICLFFVFSLLVMRNFHKSVLILGPMFILCQPYMCLRYNSPAISLIFITQFLILFCFFLKRKQMRLSSFPFCKAFYFLFFSLSVGTIVSPHSVISIIPWLISHIISYLFVVVYYNELKNLSDAKLSLKVLLFSASFLFVYFLFELVTQSNPFIQSMFDLLGIDNGWVYPTTERFGVIRCQSLMSICIAWGGFCCLIFVAILLINKYTLFDKMNIVYSCMAVLAILGVYFSGSRSAYLFLFVIICNYFFDLKGKKRLFLLIFVLMGSLFMLPSIITFVSEVFDDNISGSSFSLRQMQYIATFSVMAESPFWGFGIKGFELAKAEDSDLLGAESIWLQRMINYGLIGVLMQLYMYKSCWKYINVCGNNSVLCKFLLLGWVLYCTMTTSPGLLEPYFLSILILYCKTIFFINKSSEPFVSVQK